jgi:hypothetical protein
MAARWWRGHLQRPDSGLLHLPEDVLSGTGNNNHWGQIVENAVGCLATPASATPDADGSYVSANWGSTSCVRPGDSVTIRFWSGATVATNPTVTWNLVGGTPAAGTALQQGPVGGVAELPEVSESLPVNTESADSSLLTPSSREWQSPPWSLAAGTATAAQLGIGGSALSSGEGPEDKQI